MELKSWHIPAISVKENNQEATFAEIKKLLLGKGLISAMDEAEEAFRKFTKPLGLNINLPLICFPFSDLLSTPDNSAVCYIRLVEKPEGAEHLSLGLDLVIASMDSSVGLQLSADCRSAIGGQEPVRGTAREADIVKSLEERLKEGTHGRFLKDAEFTRSLDTLYDSTIREQLRSFINIFGASAVSGTFIEDVLPRVTELKKSDVRRLMNNQNLFSKQSSIGCSRCGASYLTFATKGEAQESLEKSVLRKCFRCDADSLDVIETFALIDALARGLTEGLWLEHLVHQIIEPMSVFSAAGVMLENFEIDVVSLTWENIILFECKDTSFGERDFWMSVPKAQALGAGTLWIVTTEPIHENVKRTIERQKRQVRFDIFLTEKLADQQSLATAVLSQLEQVKNAFLADLLTPEPRPYPYPRIWPRPLRRPPTPRPMPTA